MLTNQEIKNAKPKDKPYKLSDSKGLFLLVTPKGQKYWRLAYRFGTKQKTLSLGVYPEITLSKVRREVEKAREILRNNQDPSDTKRTEKLSAFNAQENSFKNVGTDWFNKRKGGWSKGGGNRTWRIIDKYLFPFIGNTPVNAVAAPELLAALRRIESRGTIDTAHRAKQIASQIFRFAIASGLAERDPSSDLKDALITPKTQHRAAITNPKQVGRLMVAIDNYDGSLVVRSALKLSPLLFCRPGELRHMEWSEVDFEQERVEIPAEKMKMGDPFIIPLSKQSLTILKALHPHTSNGKYVFPSARGNSRPLSENGVRVALRAMGYDNDTMCAHGFRAMARTLLDEVLEYRIEWIECQLAHAVKDANGRAYNRTSYIKQRTEMMQRWADYLDELKMEILNKNIVVGHFGR
jgi:integrase